MTTRMMLSKKIARRMGITDVKANEATVKLLDIIKKTLIKGEDVLISGFGKFQVKDKECRFCFNFAKESPMVLLERRVVTFKCSKMLRGELNNAKR